MLNLMQLLKPAKKEQAKTAKDDSERAYRLKLAKRRHYDLITSLGWDWFMKNHLVDDFKVGDKVMLNTMIGSKLPIRRDVFLHPEEGVVVAGATPCLRLIQENCNKDFQDAVIRKANNWIDDDYFKKLVMEDFETNLEHFYVQHIIRFSNPAIHDHFERGEAHVPAQLLVLRNSEVGVALHMVGLMERHILKQQDLLNGMYQTLDSISKAGQPLSEKRSS